MPSQRLRRKQKNGQIFKSRKTEGVHLVLTNNPVASEPVTRNHPVCMHEKTHIRKMSSLQNSINYLKNPFSFKFFFILT